MTHPNREISTRINKTDSIYDSSIAFILFSEWQKHS